VLHALATMAAVLRYCPKHQMYYRGDQMPEAAMPYYDRHLAEIRHFFPTPVAFHVGLKHLRTIHVATYCAGCTGAVGFV
jgi:hypothetical protein